jgi:peptidoglycan/xylan/chitin deacetylase (PgdA/CDA1 family)
MPHPTVRTNREQQQLMSNPQDERDFVGYGRYSPSFEWPNGAKIAITIAVNYEAGAETNILYGDASSEGRLNDGPTGPVPGSRVPLVESVYEYGGRRGVWRLLDLLTDFNVKGHLFACGMAIERNPEVARVFASEGHEIVGHGYRWINYQNVDIETQREHMALEIRAIENATGKRPVGWFSSSPTMVGRQLVVEDGGFLYDRDSLADELPYYDPKYPGHLVIPYSFETNDMVFGKAPGFVTGDDFFQYLREAFDVMCSEGVAGRPKLMSIGLHDRIVGRPARSSGFARFLEHATAREDVWFATGTEIAEYWRTNHPHEGN